MTGGADIARTIDAVYRAESGRVLATLIRLLRDFDRAEEAMHDAFGAAARQWPTEGVPANPRAWLVSAGRFKAIDALRRRARFDASLTEIAMRIEAESEPAELPGIEDDRLRLIFTCCHPALAPEARTALTLREVCGLTTEEVARAFLVPAPTLAQRIVRAKATIRKEHIPYEVPEADELPERLAGVLQVIYLLFNEGYAASSGDTLIRADLSAEAIRLARLVVALMPEPEAKGLLALMLVQDSRRNARSDPEGGIILLPDQDRTLWDRGAIAEGVALAADAVAARAGPYALQAAIAAEHAGAATAAATDWSRIAALYDRLVAIQPTPVVALNRAVAIAMRDGPEAGLALVDGLIEKGGLAAYPFAHSARADFCRRLGRNEEALRSYANALGLTESAPERRFLTRRIAEIEGK